MDNPYGHNRDPRHGRHRREEEEEDEYEGYPPPPRSHQPPFYGDNEPRPPFPPQTQVYHTSHVGGPDSYHPPQTQVYHTSHVGGPDSYHPPPHPVVDDYTPPPIDAADNRHHHHMPHFPSFDHHQRPHKEEGVSEKSTVRMYSKAETNYSLTIRDGKVILARSDPSDPCQHWIKDEKLSTKVKDEEGFPSFALINKATGQAMKHAIGAEKPVQLIPYNSNAVDESVLWTESKDLGDGYRAIRMVNNIRLNVDAFNGDQNHGGVHDGTTIVLWEWKKGDNQRWKIVPY